jgi:hypothetical protein
MTALAAVSVIVVVLGFAIAWHIGTKPVHTP